MFGKLNNDERVKNENLSRMLVSVKMVKNCQILEQIATYYHKLSRTIKIVASLHKLSPFITNYHKLKLPQIENCPIV